MSILSRAIPALAVLALPSLALTAPSLAHAQADAGAAPASAPKLSSLAGLRLPAPGAPADFALSRPAAAGAAPDSPTAVDGPLPLGGLKGEAGFLCGMQPGTDNSGVASAAGYDPQGRFVGARLSLPFK